MHRLMKAALIGFFINFRATDFVAALDDIHRCFFAALELADDIIDQTVFDEGFNSFWSFHVPRFNINVRILRYAGYLTMGFWLGETFAN
jgi:hypothetical protein